MRPAAAIDSIAIACQGMTMKFSREPRSDVAGATGLLANGSAGTWEIEVVEALSGPEKWFLQLDNGAFYLYCELKSLETISGASKYLAQRPKGAHRATAKDGGLVLGSFAGHAVRIAHDDEFDDRLFLSVTGDKDPSAIRVEISGDSLSEFAEAIEQVEKDLFQ